MGDGIPASSHSGRYRKFSDRTDSSLQNRQFPEGSTSLLQVPKVTKIPIKPDVMDLRVPNNWSKTKKGGDGSFRALLTIE